MKKIKDAFSRAIYFFGMACDCEPTGMAIDYYALRGNFEYQLFHQLLKDSNLDAQQVESELCNEFRYLFP